MYPAVDCWNTKLYTRSLVVTPIDDYDNRRSQRVGHLAWTCCIGPRCIGW